MIEWWKEEEYRTVAFLLLGGISLLLSLFQWKIDSLDPAWVAVILCGLPIIREAAEGMITAFDIKADLLVAMALIASVFIGEIFAAGEVAFIMMLGSLLEERTVEKARQGLENLVQSSPQKARLVIGEKESIVDAGAVKEGNIIRVLPGEIIPADGIIISGQTSVDQSVMTGEPIPVDKEEGDFLYSGTLNQMGSFTMKATQSGKNSSLQKMIRLVEEADASKAKIVGIADKMATWIVLIALLAAVFTYLITGQIIRSVTILVVFCPCALVLATPTAIMAAIGNSTKRGILIRRGDALERMSEIDTIVFDKTGTLTYGKPSFVHSEINSGVEEEDFYHLIYSLELCSEHPLAKALTSQLHCENPCPVENFQMFGGKGVEGKIQNRMIRIGNREFVTQEVDKIPQNMEEAARNWEEEGATLLFVRLDQEIAGFLVMEDRIRSDAKEAVNQLKALGISCVMLTGDQEKAACHIGEEAGLNQVVSGCLPKDKMDWIKGEQSKGHKVAMIGDGVNDAPSLKQADAGIAMGEIGSDIAVEAADAALVRDDLLALPHLFGLSRKTKKTIQINISISLILNGIAIVLAMTGILNPVIGALVHNTGSVAVIIHSALLLRWAKKEKEENLELFFTPKL